MPKTRISLASQLPLRIGVLLLVLAPAIATAQDAEHTPERPVDVVARVLRTANAAGVLGARVLGERHFLIARSRGGRPDRSLLRIEVAQPAAGRMIITCLVTDRLDQKPTRQEHMTYEIAADGCTQRLEVNRARGSSRYRITGERSADGSFRVEAERRVGAEGEVESAEIPAEEVARRLPWPLVRFVLPLLVDQGLPERLSLFETQTFVEGRAMQLRTGPGRGKLWALELGPVEGVRGPQLTFRVDLTEDRGAISIRENAILEGPDMRQGGGTLIKEISKRSHDAMIEEAAANGSGR